MARGAHTHAARVYGTVSYQGLGLGEVGEGALLDPATAACLALASITSAVSA